MNRGMIALFIGGLVVGIIAALLVLSAQPVVAGLTGQYCLQPRCYCHGDVFEFAVHQGPDQGLELEGDITYAVNSDGTFAAYIQPKDGGQRVKATGQAVGRGLDMTIVLPDERHVWAHGTLDQADLRECRGGAAGPGTGPTYGDLGDWGSNRPPYIRIISGTVQ